MSDDKPVLKVIKTEPVAPGSPFSSLVLRAPFDADATSALVLAYESLPREARRSLLVAICEDAKTEGVSPAPALLGLLGAEDDLELCTDIAAAIQSLGGDEVRPTGERLVLVRGTLREGLALLVEPLYADFVELLELRWQSGEIVEQSYEPLVNTAEAQQRHDSLSGDHPVYEDVLGVEILARVVWAERRRDKAMPMGLERFAHIFSSDAGSRVRTPAGSGS